MRISAICLGGAMALLLAMPAAGQSLWNTNHASASVCRAHGRATGPEAFSRTAQGYAWPMPAGGASAFADGTAAHVSAAAAGRANDRALADRLLAAAQAEAFTRLDFGAAGGSSPAFVDAIVVKTVAYAVAYLRSRNGLTQAELSAIAGWVRNLQRASTQRANSLDHEAAIIAANLMWAAALGDNGAFRSETSRLTRFLGRLRRNPYFTADLRNNNEVMHHVILAAQVLRQNGIDVFNAPQGSNTLNMAIAYHAGQVTENGSRPVTTAGDPSERARSILRSQGFGTHVAWVPIVLATPGTEPARPAVQALERLVRRTDGGPWWGLQIGLHTGCFFGRR